MQDQVLNFIYDAYYDKTEVLVVPESLRMKKDVSNRRETSELKAYRTKNRYEMLISNIKLFVVCCKEAQRFSLYAKAFHQPSRLLSYFGLDKENPRVKQRSSLYI